MKNGKWIAVAIIHLVVASIVLDDLRKRGKSESEAQLFSHLAGGAASVVASAIL